MLISVSLSVHDPIYMSRQTATLAQRKGISERDASYMSSTHVILARSRETWRGQPKGGRPHKSNLELTGLSS